MISIFISFLYFVYLFSDYPESSSKNDENYGIFAASLIFSIASNGLISMLLIATQLVHFNFLYTVHNFSFVVDIKKFKLIFGLS